MARAVACYEGFCVEDKNHEGELIGTLLTLGIALAVVLGVVLYNNAALIGTEMLANPFFPMF
jgi:hypothetical protein